MLKPTSMFSQIPLLYRDRYAHQVKRLNNLCRIIVVACITSSTLLSGCGQKGDLYLPDNVNSPTVHNADKNADRPDDLIDSGYDKKLDASPLPLDNPYSY